MSFKSDRSFRIWDYNVSHNQMLLRSPRSSDISKNIDIVFWGIKYVGIPSNLDGIELREALAAELQMVERILGEKCEPSKAYCLALGHGRFVVVASGFKVLQNDLDIFESSLEYFAGSDPKRDLGELLAHS